MREILKNALNYDEAINFLGAELPEVSKNDIVTLVDILGEYRDGSVIAADDVGYLLDAINATSLDFVRALLMGNEETGTDLCISDIAIAAEKGLYTIWTDENISESGIDAAAVYHIQTDGPARINDISYYPCENGIIEVW